MNVIEILLKQKQNKTKQNKRRGKEANETKSTKPHPISVMNVMKRDTLYSKNERSHWMKQPK